MTDKEKKMIQSIEIPMRKEVMEKKAAFIRGIPSIFRCNEKLLFLIMHIKKSDLDVKIGGS